MEIKLLHDHTARIRIGVMLRSSVYYTIHTYSNAYLTRVVGAKYLAPHWLWLCGMWSTKRCA